MLEGKGLGLEEKQKYITQLYNKVKKEFRGLKESYYRDKLAEELGGKKEVEVLHGFIDVMTDTEIIEIKKLKNWKSAVGQILIYGLYLEDYKKRIHLIDDLSGVNRWLIEDACRKLEISVTYEKDPVLEEVYNRISNL